MKKYKPFKIEYILLEIDWTDSHGLLDGVWSTLDKARRCNTDTGSNKSIGWLIEESDEMITIASHLSIDEGTLKIDEVSGLITIPKVAIRSRYEIDLK